MGTYLSMVMLLGVWVHNMNPVLFRIWGPLQLRWYGLAYLAGFVAAYFVLKFLARRRLWVVEESKVADFIAYAAMFGVFVGGRLGYVLFYMIPERGLGALMNDPLVVFRVWDGGMASHGGFLGLMVFTYIYARKTRVSWTGVGDGLVVAAPLGLLFGRLANFINGELYGRVTDGVAWAVKFPGALFDVKAPEYSRQAMVEIAARGVDPDVGLRTLVAEMRDNPELSEVVGEYLEPRHPSQLYEAVLEGAVLFAILLFLRLKFPKLADGVLTGTFFVLYAVFRIVAEQFREPDSAWVIENALTKGQFYSIFLLAIGAGFYLFAWRSRRPETPSSSPSCPSP
jgi:phosphatidylglycerol:prolipoprotein diacylglycerol transferase